MDLSACLVSRGTGTGLSFQNVYTENSLETQESCFSMEQRLDLLMFLYNKDNVPFWGKGWRRFARSTLQKIWDP